MSPVSLIAMSLERNSGAAVYELESDLLPGLGVEHQER